jgi:hypothetical protein
LGKQNSGAELILFCPRFDEDYDNHEAKSVDFLDENVAFSDR